jgi:multidrug efflux system membrane fusion protein
VGNDKGQIDNAKLQIAYTKITAPFSGQVGLRQVDPGNIVHTGDANGIVVVTQLQPITAIFTLPEDTIPRIMKHIQAGDKIIAEAWDRDNKTKLSAGEVFAVDNQVDQSTGTIKLRSEFSNEDNALFPSQFINIRCLLETRKDVLLVPVSAIQHGSEGTFVYLVKPDNTVTVRLVKTDIAEGDTISIADGLKAGDVVVVDGSDNLREGAKIDIPPPVPQPSVSAVSMTPVPPPEEDSHKHRHKKDTE